MAGFGAARRRAAAAAAVVGSCVSTRMVAVTATGTDYSSIDKYLGQTGSSTGTG